MEPWHVFARKNPYILQARPEPEKEIDGMKDLTIVEEPNLLENMFPYGLPPRISFTGKIVEEIDGKRV